MTRRAEILVGDALAVLKTLPADSVQACVTSPPYWGLRDYGVAEQIGLEATPGEARKRIPRLRADVQRCGGAILSPVGWTNAASGRTPSGATSDSAVRVGAGAPYTQPTDAARGRASQAGPSSGPQSKPAGFDQRRRVCAADAVHGPAGALTSGCPGVSGSSERGHRRVSAVAGVSLDIRASVGARADAGRLEATEDQGCEEQRPASARFFPRAVRQ